MQDALLQLQRKEESAKTYRNEIGANPPKQNT
jgi:hypothetical protein